MFSARFFTSRHFDARFWAATGSSAVAITLGAVVRFEEGYDLTFTEGYALTFADGYELGFRES